MFTSAVPIRRIALLTLFAFGCATVRIPVTAPDEPADGAGVIAPPIVELWIESSDQVPPAPVAVKPRAIPVAPPPQALPTVARAVPLPRYGYYRPSPVFVGFYFDFWIPPRPLVLAPETAEEPWYAPEPPAPLAVQSASEVAMLA